MSTGQAARHTDESGVSLLLGLGAGAFHGPLQEIGWITIEDRGGAGDASAPPGSQRIDSFGVDGEGSNYQALGSRRVKLEGPALSLGVSLGQPLLGSGGFSLGLEERFTLLAVLPLSGGSSIAGVMDTLLVAGQGGWPVEVAIGPSLAAARLEVPGAEERSFDEPAVIAAAAALLRLELSNTLPGTLDLVGHYGKTLNYDGSSYRDLQLAFGLAL